MRKCRRFVTANEHFGQLAYRLGSRRWLSIATCVDVEYLFKSLDADHQSTAFEWSDLCFDRQMAKETESRSKVAARSDIIADAVKLVGSVMDASCCLFYEVDRGLGINPLAVVGLDPDFMALYRANVTDIDPLDVRRLAVTWTKVGFLEEESRAVPENLRRQHAMFLSSQNIRDAIEMLFWDEDDVFAGMCIMKSASDPPISERHERHAHALQPCLESSFRQSKRFKHRRVADRLNKSFGLTEKEVEVAQHVCCGMTNDDIATVLGIHAATVKTHVYRIFDKIGVFNRTSLIAFIFELD